MKFPKSTGQVAQILNTTETQLAELVRRAKLEPVPLVVAGRRLWYEDHVLQAARELGVLTDELQQRVAAEQEVA